LWWWILQNGFDRAASFAVQTHACRARTSHRSSAFTPARQADWHAPSPWSLSAAATTTVTSRDVVSFVQEVLLKDVIVDSRLRPTEILQRTDARHAHDCATAMRLLATEELQPSSSSSSLTMPTVAFRDVCTFTDQHFLACQSLEPLLDTASIDRLRQVVEAKWQADGGTSSRFTYQRPGNYEAHVSDLGPEVRRSVDAMLLEQIYPLIRQRFWNDNDDMNAQLCVYDALYIRYNATEACLGPGFHMGAGQPLHRDLGLVSVNLMLNDDADFVGGGTLFENQLRDNNSTTVVEPLKPLGVGHALVHYSGERHAGAATRAGVRDILVVFVTAQATPPPSLLRAALLKQCRDECECDDPLQSIQCRLLHQSMAVEMDPLNGEALQYLANALIDYADAVDATKPDESLSCLEQGVLTLEEATRLTPCDARVYNTLGRALDRLSRRARRPALVPAVQAAYQTAVDILERSQRMGCDVPDLDLVRFNYGLYLSNLDLFAEAAAVLEPTASKYQPGDTEDPILANAHSIFQLCQRRM
jgi:hypothetical protein